MEILAYPILIVFFTLLFTLEMIAPASKNTCSKLWLVLASVIGFAQMFVSLAVGFVFKGWFLQHALWHSNTMPAPLVVFWLF